MKNKIGLCLMLFLTIALLVVDLFSGKSLRISEVKSHAKDKALVQVKRVQKDPAFDQKMGDTGPIEVKSDEDFKKMGEEFDLAIKSLEEIIKEMNTFRGREGAPDMLLALYESEKKGLLKKHTQYLEQVELKINQLQKTRN